MNLDDAIIKHMNDAPPAKRLKFLNRLRALKVPLSGALVAWLTTQGTADAKAVEALKAEVPGSLLADLFELGGDVFKEQLVDPIDKANKARGEMFENWLRDHTARKTPTTDPAPTPEKKDEDSIEAQQERSAQRHVEAARKRVEELRRMREEAQKQREAEKKQEDPK